MSEQALEKHDEIVEQALEVAELLGEPEEARGCVRITEQELRDLARIGVHVRDLEALDVTRGTLVVYQQSLKAAIVSIGQAIDELGKKAKKTRNDYAAMAQLSHSLARVGAQLTESQQLLIDIEKMPGAEEISDEVVNTSFRPGQQIEPCSDQ